MWLSLLNEQCYCVFGKDFPKIKVTSHFDSGQGPKLSSVRKIAFTTWDWKIFGSIKRIKGAAFSINGFLYYFMDCYFQKWDQITSFPSWRLTTFCWLLKLQFVNLEIKVVAEAPKMKNSSNFKSHMLKSLKCKVY